MLELLSRNLNRVLIGIESLNQERHASTRGKHGRIPGPGNRQRHKIRA